MKKILKSIVILIVTAAAALALLGGGWGTKVQTGGLQTRDSLILFAHRGMINYFPENTMAGFEAARKTGIKAIEVDIRKSIDGQYFLFHDEGGWRLLGLQQKVAELTYDELKKQNIRFNGIPGAEPIVRLDDFLHRYRNDFLIYLDLKISSFADADQIAAIIEKNQAAGSTVVASARVVFLSYLEYRHPQINTVLEGFTSGKEWLYPIWPKNFRSDYLASFAKDIDGDQLDWLKRHRLLNKRIVYDVNRNNLDSLLGLGLTRMIVDYDSGSQKIRQHMLAHAIVR